LIILAAAPALALDKLRISYASVTSNTTGITSIAQHAGQSNNIEGVIT
jgi:hypothetical protein